MLKKPIRTTLPFHTEQENQYFRKSQCYRECLFGTITDKSHLPPFLIVREKRVDDITLTIQCLDGTAQQIINPLVAFNCLRFVNSDEKASIESFPLTVGDSYFIEEAGSVVNSWQSLVGRKVTWNGAVWIDSAIGAEEGQFIEETQLNLIHIWSDTEWIKTLNGLQIVTIGDYDYICYNGFELSTNLSCGIRELVLEDSVETFYSELVDVRQFNYELNDYHKIIIENDCNLGNIPYEEFIGFRQYFYFDKETLIGTPEYLTEEETEKDGLGNELTLFQKQMKLQLLESLLVPEYIVDFLNFVTLHDRKFIKVPNSDIENLIDNYEVVVEWISVGCYANCTIKFSDEEDITNTGCCTEAELTACYLPEMTIIDVVDVVNRFAIEAATPNIGDSYIIGTDLTMSGPDIWLTNFKKIAVWNGIAWDYINPEPYVFYYVTGQISNWIYVDSFDVLITNDWVQMPTLFVSVVGVELFEIKVAVANDMFACLYAKNGDTGAITYLGSYNKEDLETGVVKELEGCIDWTFYAIAKSSNDCEYGKSNEETETYEDCVCLGTC